MSVWDGGFADLPEDEREGCAMADLEDSQEDYGDADEGLIERIREAAEERQRRRNSDEERSARAERSFQAQKAARALWDQVLKAIWGKP